MRTTRRGFGLDHDSFMTSYKLLNPGTLNTLGPRTASGPASYGDPCIGAHRIVRHSAGLIVFCCAMLAFVRDPCVTKAKWLNPITVDPLGMCNGLAPSRFGAQCTGPHHPVL